MPDAEQPRHATEHEITALLARWSDGDREALDQLMPLVFEELRRLARAHFARESKGHTLQPTALVDELFVRLLKRRRVQWHNRGQFFQAATELMRYILVDHARRRRAVKRGGDRRKVPLTETAISTPVPELAEQVDILALHQALDRLDDQRRRIVELKFYFGLTHRQIGAELGIAADTVKEKWAFARAHLFRQLKRE